MMSDTPSLEHRFEQLARENEQRKSELEKLGEATKAYRGLTAIKTIWLFGFAALVFFSAVALIPGVQVWIATKLGVAGVLYGQSVESSATIGGNSRDAGDPAIFGQFMTLFLAVAAGGIAYMASMMGMRRLENYDQQFAEFRKEHRDFENTVVQKVTIEKSILDGRMKEVQAATEISLDDQKSALRTALLELENSAQEQIKQAEQRFKDLENTLNARYGFIATIRDDVRESLRNNLSISEAHRLVTQWSISGKIESARELMNTLLANRFPDREALRATGDVDDWFNLGSQLGQNDEFSLGLKVNLAGLLQEGTIALNEGVDGLRADQIATLDLDKMIGFEVGADGSSRETLLLGSPNTDLFSHTLSYAAKLGLRRMLEGLLRIAKLIPLENRNWRYYQFLGDIYAERNDKESFDSIVDEFGRRISTSERSKTMQVSWHVARSEFDQALELGRAWLTDSSNRGSALPLKLAQVALDATEYNFVLELTLRALEGSAAGQPGASIAALLFYRANAYDSLFCREAAAQSIDCEKLIEYYRKAQRLYSSEIVTSLAYQNRPASDRLKAMRLLLEETGCTPIEEADDRALDGQPNGDDDRETDVAENQLLASLNNGIGTFLNDGDTETAVRGFLENSDPLQRLGLTHLRRFMAEDDTPPEIAAAARKFHDAILAARGD